MGLTVEQAQALYQQLSLLSEEIERDGSLASIGQAETSWQKMMEGNLFASKPNNYSQLNKALIDIRKANLDRRSVVIYDTDDTERDNPIRFYNPNRKGNINYDVDDVFARGLDSARAVNEILANAPDSSNSLQALGQSNQSKKDLMQLIRLIAVFQRNMQAIKAIPNKKEAMKQAIAESKRFNGVLASLLVDEGIIQKPKQAVKAIHFVRDFLWKKDICMPFCSLENDEECSMLRYAEPVRFEALDFKDSSVSENRPLDYWKPMGDSDQPWLRKLKKSLGSQDSYPWFDNFLTKNEDDLKSLSSTAMSRSTPNASNAFRTTDILFDDEGNPRSSLHAFKIAATEPIDVGDTTSMQDLTDYNHLQFLTGKQLEENLNIFMQRWGMMFREGDPIPFTLLHQTLIGDEVVFSPDQLKAKASKIHASVIDSKISANNAMRKMISEHVIVRDPNNGKITWYPKKSYYSLLPSARENHKIVNIDLLQTNDGINMWYFRARVRNNDVNDARQLIANAVTLYEKIPVELLNEEERENLTIITNFLKSSNYSLLRPSKFKGDTVRNALRDLTVRLKERSKSKIELTTNTGRKLPNLDNLALSLNAAVELKCTVNETYFGAARRNISNFSREYFRRVPILGTLADWFVRGTFGAVALIAKIPFLPVVAFNWFYYGSYRKVVFKAAYEGILADTIGNLTGGCMSALDRAGEMSEQRAMMMKQFHDENKIISYNDSAEEKDRVYSEYNSTQNAHDYAETATGTPGKSDKETEGFFANIGLMCFHETAEEKELSAAAAKLRKYSFKATTQEKYLAGADDITSPSLEIVVKEESEDENDAPNVSPALHTKQEAALAITTSGSKPNEELAAHKENQKYVQQ